ncbi:hypothetical protein [Bradyrhizobium sp.]|nr:hypothetical protein [Bradyrhizobium sp.]HZR77431.1 hypothetical protein [Bradyrhizobium sp.]
MGDRHGTAGAGTLVCGTAAFDDTQVKGLLAMRYGIQVTRHHAIPC